MFHAIDLSEVFRVDISAYDKAPADHLAKLVEVDLSRLVLIDADSQQIYHPIGYALFRPRPTRPCSGTLSRGLPSPRK